MIRIILTDIEGTTSAISFVHEVLFPYAAENLPAFVKDNHADASVRAELDAVADEAGLEPDDIEGIVDELQRWIKEDRKATPLKSLQGMIWQQGYERGDFKSHVYDDAADYLRHWHDRGLRLYVYSSGSVQAQKLIFGYSIAGDLTPFFSGYFDTRVGGKREAGSYRNILDGLGVEPATVLFLSDVEEELVAAEAAGLQTCLVARQDNPGARGTASDKRNIAADFTEVDRLLLADSPGCH